MSCLPYTCRWKECDQLVGVGVFQRFYYPVRGIRCPGFIDPVGPDPVIERDIKIPGAEILIGLRSG